MIIKVILFAVTVSILLITFHYINGLLLNRKLNIKKAYHRTKANYNPYHHKMIFSCCSFIAVCCLLFYLIVRPCVVSTIKNEREFASIIQKSVISDIIVDSYYTDLIKTHSLLEFESEPTTFVEDDNFLYCIINNEIMKIDTVSKTYVMHNCNSINYNSVLLICGDYIVIHSALGVDKSEVVIHNKNTLMVIEKITITSKIININFYNQELVLVLENEIDSENSFLPEINFINSESKYNVRYDDCLFLNNNNPTRIITIATICLVKENVCFTSIILTDYFFTHTNGMIYLSSNLYNNNLNPQSVLLVYSFQWKRIVQQEIFDGFIYSQPYIYDDITIINTVVKQSNTIEHLSYKITKAMPWRTKRNYYLDSKSFIKTFGDDNYVIATFDKKDLMIAHEDIVFLTKKIVGDSIIEIIIDRTANISISKYTMITGEKINIGRKQDLFDSISNIYNINNSYFSKDVLRIPLNSEYKIGFLEFVFQDGVAYLQYRFEIDFVSKTEIEFTYSYTLIKCADSVSLYDKNMELLLSAPIKT